MQSLQDHISRHGSSPHVEGIDAMGTILDSPGMARVRLSAVDSPKDFERCLRNLVDIVIECNSWISVQGSDTIAATREYLATKAGRNYVETKTLQECAWEQLCKVHGNSRPKIDHDRIEFLLAQCAAYRGHHKTKRTLLKELRMRGTTITNVLFSVAVTIIGAAATCEDEINMQMGADTNNGAKAAVNAVGADTAQRHLGGARMGASSGAEKCNICARPGHNARDCLQFMQREGTCGHWFMHSIGKYKTGCTYGSACRKKHERPSIEPPANAHDGKAVATMATGVLPQTNGGKQVHQEMQVGDVTDTKFVIMPNETKYWVSSSHIWLQPEDEDDSLCANCDETHSQIAPCKNGGCHSMLTLT